MTATRLSPPMLGVLRLMAATGEPLSFQWGSDLRLSGWYCGDRALRVSTVWALKSRGLVAPVDGRLRLTDAGRAAVGGQP